MLIKMQILRIFEGQHQHVSVRQRVSIKKKMQKYMFLKTKMLTTLRSQCEIVNKKVDVSTPRSNIQKLQLKGRVLPPSSGS